MIVILSWPKHFSLTLHLSTRICMVHCSYFSCVYVKSYRHLITHQIGIHPTVGHWNNWWFYTPKYRVLKQQVPPYTQILGAEVTGCAIHPNIGFWSNWLCHTPKFRMLKQVVNGITAVRRKSFARRPQLELSFFDSPCACSIIKCNSSEPLGVIHQERCNFLWWRGSWWFQNIFSRIWGWDDNKGSFICRRLEVCWINIFLCKRHPDFYGSLQWAVFTSQLSYGSKVKPARTPHTYSLSWSPVLWRTLQ